MRAAPGRIRVLVVDDSVVIRRLVTEALAEDPQIEVVGIASNGKIALEKIAQLKPDAVTMDIEMPVMNGIEAVRQLRRRNPRLPVVMFSTLTERGASATLDALGAGASDYVTKPSNVGSFAESQQNIRDQLIPKLKALTGTRRAAGITRVPPPSSPRRLRTGPFGILAIGSSTGGPDALARVLPALPGDLSVPVVVVQHMPPLFTRLLAQRLDSHCRLRVTEAVEGEEIAPGKVLIAPGGLHLTVRRQGATIVARLTEDPPENFCRPSVDVLFRSVSSLFGDRVLAAVLTGMGKDGEKGAIQIRSTGGEVFAQDEPTSVVWGMPGAVAMAGQADRILALDRIGPDLASALARGPRPVEVSS
ncbi:MAG: two-component system, chemotaxis family, protein-glutamate methylesterase/glutaminase [Actinomycetota bacterium]|nr:two-component system, chemotaxis family, protein-glutamate methylesterase/glutaminase [Actinomycetota bacterium]